MQSFWPSGPGWHSKRLIQPGYFSIWAHICVCTHICVDEKEPLNIQHYFENYAHLCTEEWLMKPTSYWGREECLSLNLHLVLATEDTLPVVYNNTLHCNINWIGTKRHHCIKESKRSAFIQALHKALLSFTACSTFSFIWTRETWVSWERKIL